MNTDDKTFSMQTISSKTKALRVTGQGITFTKRDL